MSSSRSIAAARNRRAGGDPQPVQRSRPNTSIASQAAFSQQSQPMQQTQNRRFEQQPQLQAQPQKNPQLVPVNKISVSDAIGLITIRLGRVEQYMQQLQQEGGISLPNGLSENVQLIDKDVLTVLTDRVYTLENKPLPIDANIYNKYTILENEITEIKKMLNQHISKIDQFINETQERFIDVDTAFVELEKSIQNSTSQMILESENIHLNVEENNKEETDTNQDQNVPTFSSVDLKNMIQEELANSQM